MEGDKSRSEVDENLAYTDGSGFGSGGGNRGPVTGEIVDDIRNMGIVFHIPAYFRLHFK